MVGINCKKISEQCGNKKTKAEIKRKYTQYGIFLYLKKCVAINLFSTLTIEQSHTMAFSLLKKVTAWLKSGEKRALLKEEEIKKERDVCTVLVIILFLNHTI